MLWYWTAAVILTLLNAFSVLANFLMLPGNWVMVANLAIFILATKADRGPTWNTLIIVVVIAGIGEVLELMAGSAGASRKGASRRAMLLSLLLSIAGSVVGAFVIPVPVVGSAIGAVAGAALGAFWGAWLGEAWVGSDVARRNEISTAAMIGRIIGMFAKLFVGIAIFVFQIVCLWM